MKEPLNSNLALNFLFKNQEIGELLKNKQQEIDQSGISTGRNTMMLPSSD